MAHSSALSDLLDRPIAYHRCFVNIAGSVSGAVFLSQVCYWSKHTTRRDGFFYKTDADWCQETGIPARTQDRIRSVLRSKGILLEKLEGIPATVHYKLDKEALISNLEGVPSGTASTCQVAELNVPSGLTISETTSETTQKEETAKSENLENQPCSKCGEVGVHRCGGYKSKKQREREARRAAHPKFTPEPDRATQYRPRFTPTVPDEDEGEFPLL